MGSIVQDACGGIEMLKRGLLAGLAVIGWVGAASAAPITYEGILSDGVPDTGAVSSSGIARSAESALSDYWSFDATAGDSVAVMVTRLESDFDPALWIFFGLFADDSAFGGGFVSGIDTGDPGFVVSGDDEVTPPSGPWGDPLSAFVAPSTGTYTAIVVNGLSDPDDGGDGFFDYQILLTRTTSTASVPEPATMALLGLGLAGLGLTARRRRTA